MFVSVLEIELRRQVSENKKCDENYEENGGVEMRNRSKLAGFPKGIGSPVGRVCANCYQMPKINSQPQILGDCELAHLFGFQISFVQLVNISIRESEF